MGEYNCYSLVLSATANINALSGIIKIDEIFFYESLKGKHIISYRKGRKRGRRRK